MNNKKAVIIAKEHNEKLKEWLNGFDDMMIYVHEPKRIEQEKFLELLR